MKEWLWELDGKQHFEGILFGSKSKTKEDVFKDQRKRDNLKDGLVMKFDAHLLRTPYTHSTQDQMLRDVEYFLEERKSMLKTGFIMRADGAVYKAVFDEEMKVKDVATYDKDSEMYI
jgi:hypothetical protein